MKRQHQNPNPNHYRSYLGSRRLVSLAQRIEHLSLNLIPEKVISAERHEVITVFPVIQ